MVKRTALNALVGRDAAIARDLFALTSRELHHMQQRVLLLFKSAQERVASFLSKWPSAARRPMRSSCRCRARIWPTISA